MEEDAIDGPERNLDHLPAVVWEREAATGRFTYVSDEMRRMLGFEPSSLTVDPAAWTGHVHPEDRDGVAAAIVAALTGGRNTDLVYRVLAADGSLRWVRDIGAVVAAQGRPLHAFGVLVDVTGRRLACEQLHARGRRLARQSAALGSLVRDGTLHAGPFATALRRAIEEDAEALEVTRVGYWVLDAERGSIRNIALHDPRTDSPGSGEELLASDHPIYFEAVAADRVVRIDDTLSDPRTGSMVEPYLRPHGIRSMLDAPVRVGGRVVGILCHEQVGAPRVWTPEEQAFAASVGDLVSLALEADARRVAEVACAASESRLKVAFESAPHPVLVYDKAGRITMINAAAERALLRRRTEALKRRLDEVVEPGGLDPTAPGPPPANRVRIRRGDGTTFPAEIRASRLSPEGETVLVIHDVSARLADEEELARYRQHLEELVEARTTELLALNRDLEAFSYSVSHDLRAPLRAVDGHAALLAEEGDALGPRGLDRIARIRASVARMSALIEALLCLARVGRAEVRPTRVDISAIAEEIGETLRDEAPDRDVRLTVAPGLVATTDEVLVRCVLDNLLRNAWKFTSRRSGACIEVGARATAKGSEIFVRDNGVGFDVGLAGVVFEPFRRLHRADEFEGTGIGLAIVRRAVERLGGTVRAEGAPGRGATFHFSLPA